MNKADPTQRYMQIWLVSERHYRIVVACKLTIQMTRKSNERPSSVKLRSVDPDNAAVLQQLTLGWVTP
jgi:hypothetical protein